MPKPKSRPKIADLVATIVEKDAEIARLTDHIKDVEEYAQFVKAELIGTWQEGYKAGRENVEAQNVPEMARVAEQGYQQAVRDLAWQPSASDYL